MKRAIIVLTRGYSEVGKYATLIKRNEDISRQLYEKEIPLLIFHEGNILESHQIYIQEKTPELNISFYNVCSHDGAFRKEKEDIEKIQDPALKNFGKGYFHMCSFWFVDFWKFVAMYDTVLRIDEDCYIDFSVDKAFEKLVQNPFLYGSHFTDSGIVVKGLNEFSKAFCIENNIHFQKRSQTGPYTNVIGLNLTKIKDNELLKKYISQVDASNNIYKYRWGDLPLWGEVMEYIFNIKVRENVDTTLKYFHGSHGRKVNYVMD